MPAKIIISYDGTANEEDAIALGRLFGQAGAQLAVAYVSHGHDSPGDTQGLLDRGLELLGSPQASGHVVNDPSTPEGLASLADSEDAQAIVFCSDSHTANGHVSIGNSAQRLLSGGRAAIAIAPVGLAERGGDPIKRIVAVGDGDGGARQTAESLAAALGGEVAPVANEDTDLVIVDSRAEVQDGRISLSASAEHLIEGSASAVLVLPRGVSLQFGGAPANSVA